MKITIVAIIAVAIIAVLAGCKSTSTNIGVTTVQTDTNGVLFIGSTRIDPAAAGVAVKMGAKYGAQALLKSNPDSRQYLAIAAQVINAAIVNQTYDPAQLQSALLSALTPASNANNAAAISAAISDGLDLYRLFYGQVATAKINQVSPYLSPCLQGLADGISSALVESLQPKILPSVP